MTENWKHKAIRTGDNHSITGDALKNVRLHPWIGGKYGRDSRFGMRLLVLGESHYGEDSENWGVKFTQGVVRHWGQTARSSFFTRISKVLLGITEWIDDDTRADIWEHIAFYNFVQTILPTARSAPTYRQWREAELPFRSVLEILNPDAVLILGWRLSEHVLYRPRWVAFGEIAHPSSSRLRYDEGIQIVQDLLARARKMRALTVESSVAPKGNMPFGEDMPLVIADGDRDVIGRTVDLLNFIEDGDSTFIVLDFAREPHELARATELRIPVTREIYEEYRKE